jgi:chemotaxis response regulator CheB
MPRHAIEAGAASEVLTLDAIAPRLLELCKVVA